MCLSGYVCGSVKEVRAKKARTKREALLLSYADRLPALTAAQREYSRRHLFPREALYWRGDSRVWCQCCGHTYRQPHGALTISLELDEETCPRCGERLRLKHAAPRQVTNNVGAFMTIMTTYKGYQVFRTFDATRENTLFSDTKYDIREVYQNWFDEAGREVIISRSYSRSVYWFHWKYESAWGIKKHNASARGYYTFDDVFELGGNVLYPRGSVLPILKRNGWCYRLAKKQGVDPGILAQRLLVSGDFEMLAKTGQWDIIRWALRRGDWTIPHLASIKVCTRHGYRIKDADLWYDLISCLAELGLDTHSPHYICPADLREAHDRFMRRAGRLRERRELENKRTTAKQNEARYKKEKGRFFGIAFGNQDVEVSVIGSVAAVLEEGVKMHHCVYDNGYWKKADSLLLSARDPSTGERLETVEFSLKTMKVLQSRARCNGTSARHDEILSLVAANVGLIRAAM